MFTMTNLGEYLKYQGMTNIIMISYFDNVKGKDQNDYLKQVKRLDECGGRVPMGTPRKT